MAWIAPVIAAVSSALGNAQRNSAITGANMGTPESLGISGLSALQFQQAMQQIDPTMQILTDFIANPQLQEQFRQQAAQRADQQMSAITGFRQSLLNRLGVKLSPEAAQQTQLSDLLAKGKAEAAASNVAAQGLMGLQSSVITGMGGS
ncbi:MAG: hypothetical protein IRZ03_16730 [Acidobacterium ailaaui]|nr:hypothetical protein [Pseudacidobacterium ailaaui]